MIKTHEWDEGIEYIVDYPIINTGEKWYPITKIIHFKAYTDDKYRYRGSYIHVALNTYLVQHEPVRAHGVEYFKTIEEAETYCKIKSSKKVFKLDYIEPNRNTKKKTLYELTEDIKEVPIPSRSKNWLKRILGI